MKYYGNNWRKASRAYLSANPVCVMCARQGYVTAANTVDHIIPHKGDMDLFWNEDNWQSLCHKCHSSHKQLQELHGYTPAADENGFPLDIEHPWSDKNARKKS